MIKKVLILLVWVVLLEFSVLFTREREIELSHITTTVVKDTSKKDISPGQNFGELLAYKIIPAPQVLSETTQKAPLPEEYILYPKKKSYIIAVMGDSMVDTMGDSVDYLKSVLNNKYPGIEFKMHNYGIGAEKVTNAIERFNKPYSRGTRNYISIPDLKPDILIVGSYAYNPFDVHDRNKHWLTLIELVEKAKNVTPNVYILAEISPLEENFGTGPGGVNWPEELAKAHTVKIIEQMENAIGIAKELNIPLINVYDKTRKENSKYGKEEYVSSHDNIHPSVLGQQVTAQVEASVIQLDKEGF